MRSSKLHSSSASDERRLLVQIGPDPQASQGGMASVIGNLMASERINQSYRQVLYPSFKGGSAPVRLTYSFKQEKAFSPDDYSGAIFHIHLGPGRSAWRKMSYINKLGVRSKSVVLHVHASVFDAFFSGLSEKDKGKVRRCFNGVGKVIVLSEEWKTFFLANDVCDERLIEVVHNAVSIPDVEEKDYGARNVLFLGRLCDRKSPETLIEAAALVAHRFPDAIFTFAGDGDAAPYVKLAQTLGIGEQCRFPGWTSGDDKKDLLCDHTVFCLPSKGEGMPMSLLEAMSYGLAAIATPVGGVPQVVSDGVNGLLSPAGDSNALAERLGALLADEDLRSNIGLAGRKMVIDGFSMASFENSMLNIYEEIHA